MTGFTKKALLGASGLALAAGLVLAPAAAFAHVSVDPSGEASPGSETTLTFGINHGCDGSPTTSVAVSMPEGLSGVHPIADANWTIETERDGDAGRVSTVIYTATTPLPNDIRGEVKMLVGFADDAADPLAFPVEQTCEDGSTSWSEVASPGEDPHDLEAPAPVLEFVDAAPAVDADSPAESGPSGLEVAGYVATGAAVVISLAALGIAVSASRRKS
ncbi:YcnI family protein [Microbacterium gubbeenense]|uniref:YcnI family protein n=1 Tax=Microbacterium gubbeenense TaxID=159896 RepID=UPI003F9824D9